MKILETAVIADEYAAAETFLAPLFSQKESILGTNVYRWEISEDLVMLLYIIQPGGDIPEEIYAHLQPHLRAVLIVLSDPTNVLDESLRPALDAMVQKFEPKPVVVSVQLPLPKIKALPDVVKKHGFYLSEKGRILFWHPEVPGTRKNVFLSLWENLREQ